MIDRATRVSEAVSPAAGAEMLHHVDRLQSIEEIKQLSHKYALAFDMRDWDAVTALFVEDIELPMLPGRPRGRAALRDYFIDAMEFFRSSESFHANTNIIVEFYDDDPAFGAVLTRSDDDCGTQYLHGSFNFSHEYERVDGVWLITRREVLYWHLCDPQDRALGDRKIRFPIAPPKRGQLPVFWGAWAEDAARASGPPAADFGGSFLRRIRRLPAAEHRPDIISRQFVDWLGMPEATS